MALYRIHVYLNPYPCYSLCTPKLISGVIACGHAGMCHLGLIPERSPHQATRIDQRVVQWDQAFLAGHLGDGHLLQN